jgi:multicomponent Na+:H+ antiporter subunit E
VSARPRRPLVDLRHHAPLLVWLVLVWVFLWETLSWGNIIAGAVLALVVTRVFHLPSVELSGRFNI